MKRILMGMSTGELKMVALELGEKGYRGKQVADWIYRRGCREFSEMANLPANLKMRLEKEFVIGRSRTVKMRRAKDNTFKLLLEPVFGEFVETVGMPYDDRFSCCVSTQVGCVVGCAFCATGASGFKRNLAAGEIVDQVLTVREAALKDGLMAEADRISHVVFMGMGEPLVNYDATLAAVRSLNTELNIGMRNITVSTIGYVPGIYRLAAEQLQLTLAVSLHASEDVLRRKLVPGMSRYSLDEIIQACRAYFTKTGRRITFEYCLLKGVNDTVADASGLAVLLKGLNCHVNLIPFNPFDGSSFRPPESKASTDFKKVIEDASIPVTQREQRGVLIDAACGQLRRHLQ